MTSTTRLTARIARFWSKVDKSAGETGCWLWMGYCDHRGYGRLGWKMGKIFAHRLAWELTRGAIPDALCVLHNCPDGDNPRCVNPAHLFLGTQLDNIDDRVRKNRSARGEHNGSKTHPERRPRGEQHPMCKLTEAEARALKARYAQGGITQLQLSQQSGISRTQVSNIVSGKKWTNL